MKVKVGVFGAARGMSMINIMARHPEAELVAICDKYEPLMKRCRKVAEETGSKITTYHDFESFMQHDMDAVVLANYANEHAPFAVRLLKSGRHVISEVLPVETMAQAVDLVEAVETSGKVYAYAENYCYFSATQEMKALYRKGEIGEFMHGEGEYVHDCESIWPDITYGEKNHWRNNMYATYYCTHSLGPIISITGTRPVKVVGFETPPVANMAGLGYKGGTSGMILAQMNNGATVKSLHGHLKREPGSVWYSIYGRKGMMESDRWGDTVDRIHIYREGDQLTGTDVSYRPRRRFAPDLAKLSGGHGGGDFYTMHFFLEKILGRPDGAESIDIYQALDMGLPGLLAFRSILKGNIPIEVPDFRFPEIREHYRADHFSTNPAASIENRLPNCSFTAPEIPDTVYNQVRKNWLAKQEDQRI